MKKNTTELGKVISEARENKGISQRELSRQANMDCAEVSRIESGKRKKPNILYLKGIADTLDLSMVKLMELAGYNDVDINFGKDLSNRRSETDYQNQIKNYEKFYFDVLEDIEERRKSARECKGIFADIIDRIDNADFYSSKITLEEISEKLKEASRTINRNMEKLDKEKYPQIDMGVLPKINNSSVMLNTITGEFIDKEN